MNTIREPVNSIYRGIPVWIIPAAVLGILVMVIGYNGMYGQDSFEYLRYSRALHAFFVNGTAPGRFLWPVLYPLAGSILSFIIPDILALQAISLICFALSGYFLIKILNLLFPEHQDGNSLYSILFFSLAPFLLRYAASIMTEAMAISFVTGFFYYYFSFIRRLKPTFFLMLSIFGAATINTRYASAVILIIPGIHAILVFFRHFNTGIFLASVFGFILLFLPGIYFTNAGEGLSSQVSDARYWSSVFTQWSPVNFFRNSFITENGQFQFFLPNILWVLSNMIYPGFIFTGILFIFFIRTKGEEWKYLRPVVFTLILYWIFLAGLPLQNDRILLLSFPLVIMIFSGTFLWVYDRLNAWDRRWIIPVVIIIILVQMALFYRAFIPFYEDSLTTRKIARHIMNYEGQTIYTFNIDQALKVYGVKNRIINIWEKKVGDVSAHSLVLFNFTKSSVQWKGMNPMLNWEKIKREHRLKLLERFDEGWELYEITD